MEKLLSLKKDNNIMLYKLSYNDNSLKDYLRYLSNLYGYGERKIIETSLINKVPLSMGKYDNLKKYCSVDKEYRLIEEKSSNNNITIAKIEIRIKYHSMISKLIRKVFMSEGVLLDCTDLIKLKNLMLDLKNNFTFDEIFISDEKNKEWNDPSRIFLNQKDYDKYIEYLKVNLNNPIQLNKLENNSIRTRINDIIEELYKIISFEQVGMFPITDNLQDYYDVLTRFGNRNEEFEEIFGSLENEPININGSQIINDLEKQVTKEYIDRKNICIKEEQYPKIKSFLNFKAS